uniref:Uncharacterized protein n=1 Tax=Entomoneis paludosa TaxID=265537 RepID=A0A7S2YNX1_9STRA|mmetsp:Transcript_40677/g.84676  ORF Transcript_40677/g.84676 Transcript_40677/m.84676 type:complete len:214 (+) Transcript_40677:94-735(+)|eukprot:CAMPEP_0172443422 /NCGR_PEP_ID=MMETSP1065-20121228/3687_1 /TAXON_ID=265537 /ORGANISM="Amphiprora paludosa, Strain CCMP125" /LENGTH=213 /DNA_ID=CAMNT_0013193645 /DNA_START=41 /DNA_END=682 /DNA_ORIENTATION=+
MRIRLNYAASNEADRYSCKSLLDEQAGHDSDSSTLSIGRDTPFQKQPQHNASADSTKRSVSFDFTATQSYPAEAEEQEDSNDTTWYTHEELAQFRQNLIHDTRAFYFSERRSALWQRTLHRLYQECSSVESSSDLLSNIQERLCAMYDQSDSILGLERTVIKFVYAQAHQRRTATLEQFQSNQSSNMEAINLPSRRFAQELGSALSQAISSPE